MSPGGWPEELGGAAARRPAAARPARMAPQDGARRPESRLGAPSPASAPPARAELSSAQRIN